ncbi:heme anaerobic degradation radical SAM methyltransferase ChuW/HutW [Thalassospira xiamenensis]|uniref:Coproporphyrinogen III oxidase n=1 Tax=Thalassospira xiamenensis TaxID=220697 RepID=A0A367X8K4_9PROT|nr:heme anaerobic degradation radical SAM methyltransferase ChuW/HutW [Thalassospira xiamenensis]KZB56355.1 putative heme utilization radical SAM enzyme HutW [Thalassospira xiamenensis]MCK2167199.1 heme anaerobic degradation radical SAM methyltransferase ChuW/HutW [Thalassospira xiamenensis]RCK49996.1 coproporphyrinogen III oxidase [Thalassospira xiamenensis]
MTSHFNLEAHFANGENALEQAFARRNLFPWIQRGVRPLANPHSRYRELVSQKTTRKCVAYVHIPFCANHCLFCGFYRDRSSEEVMRDYVDHLIREIESDPAKERADTINAVYLGGGTPSALSAKDLQRVIGTLRNNLSLAPDCEITVEGRVAGFDDERVDACFDAGVNRISIGIQSFDTNLRRRFGRKADKKDIVSFLSGLCDRDKGVIVCDLIFGLPGQTRQMWEEDIRLCASLKLDGVDLYCLTVHEKGPLALSIEKGALPLQAPLPEMAQMYEAGLEIIEHAGWRHLNQAHWAAGTRERNLYNQLVKAGADCLAFGSGAGGMLDGHRYVVDGDRASYQRRIVEGEKPVAMILPPARHYQARDLVMGGIEGGRLDLAALEYLTAPGFVDALSPLVNQWEQSGLVVQKGTVITLTTAGWFWHCNLVGSLFELIAIFMDGRAVDLPRFEFTKTGK